MADTLTALEPTVAEPRRVTRKASTEDFTSEITVEGYSVTEAIQIFRALDDGDDVEPWQGG